MSDDIQEMKRVLRMLSRAERLLQSGVTFENVFEKLRVSREQFEDLFDQYAMPPNAAESLSASPVGRAVFPIFHNSDGGDLEHVGSGVLVEIGRELFALSAAHVIDYANDGNLYMPGVTNLEAMHGTIAHGKLPESGQRKDDRVDIAYYHLAGEWRDKLHPDITPATIDDLLLTDSVQTGNIHTFLGYPWRKTKRQGIVFSGDRTTYTGHLLPPDFYEKFGYSRIGHVLIRMRLNKTHSTRYGPNSPAAHPAGISGGAVLSWPSRFKARVISPALKLAAIAHSYHERDHCMAATRVIPCLMAIVRQNPHLAIHFDHVEYLADELRDFLDEVGGSFERSPVQSAIGIAWYKEDTYQRCLSIFDDAPDLPDTFEKWRLVAESVEAGLLTEHIKAIRVEIDPDKFPAWCKEHGFLRIDKDARIAFSNLNAFESLQQDDQG